MWKRVLGLTVLGAVTQVVAVGCGGQGGSSSAQPASPTSAQLDYSRNPFLPAHPQDHWTYRVTNSAATSPSPGGSAQPQELTITVDKVQPTATGRRVTVSRTGGAAVQMGAEDYNDDGTVQFDLTSFSAAPQPAGTSGLFLIKFPSASGLTGNQTVNWVDNLVTSVPAASATATLTFHVDNRGQRARSERVAVPAGSFDTEVYNVAGMVTVEAKGAPVGLPTIRGSIDLIIWLARDVGIVRLEATLVLGATSTAITQELESSNLVAGH